MMIPSLRVLNITVLAILCAAPPLASQDASATMPYYVYMRAGGESPAYAYALYSVEKVVFGVGVLADWRNAYREFAAGAGLNLYGKTGNGATTMAAVAHASDSWYVQLWVFPVLSTGRLSLTGFGGAYIPAEQPGVWQYFLDPVAVFWRVRGPIAIGGAYSGYKIAGFAVRQGLGPAVQLALPHGSAILEVLREVTDFRDDVRITLQFTF